MSELVPEPRQKPVVPMKPTGINTNLLGYIGIDTIIEQMRKKTMKTGFDFNIMVVGKQGPDRVLGTMARGCPMRPGGEQTLQGGHEGSDSACSEKRRACTRQGDIYSPFSCQPGFAPWACCHYWAVADVTGFLFAIRRSEWTGEVNTGEHSLQISGEPQIFRLEPGGEDPQDSGDQSHWAR